MVKTERPTCFGRYREKYLRSFATTLRSMRVSASMLSPCSIYCRYIAPIVYNVCEGKRLPVSCGLCVRGCGSERLATHEAAVQFVPGDDGGFVHSPAEIDDAP